MKADINKIGIFYLLFLVMGLVAIGRIIDLQFIDRPQRGIYGGKYLDSIKLECTRGSILATDGRLMAFSIPEYKIALDPCQVSDEDFEKYIDPLCDSLSSFLHEKKAKEYSTYFRNARKMGKRYVPISRNFLTFHQMKYVSTFPILCKGQLGGGFMVQKFGRRQYPYGNLAYRTLGRCKDGFANGIGIEGSCDSILKGIDGVEPTRLTEKRKWIVDYERESREPVDGIDVRTTIDIDIQELADKALRKTLAGSDEMEAGTVIVLETSTGKIRAMVNLMKQKDGSFDETYNYAIGRKGEPGSVFKLATLCCVIDDGKAHVDDVLAVGPEIVYGKTRLSDHYLHSNSTTILHGFEISSNNVFRMLAIKYYSHNPAEFVEKLNDKIKISYNYKFDINGFAKAHIRHPEEKLWAPVDLPQIGMGYTSELTPMHTVCFYNAIANGGVMVKPHLIESFEKNGEVIREFPTEVIGTVCKPSTVKELHKALREVVEGDHGTGRRHFAGCKVSVGGKTGTAHIVHDNGSYVWNGKKKYQATFIGMFPMEKPEYTVISVVYSYPTIRQYYGATWSGPVVRQIVDGLYAMTPEWKDGVKCTGKVPETREAIPSEDDSLGGVPDVRGMGLRSGMDILESLGYKVAVKGRGVISDIKILDIEGKKDTVVQLILAQKI